MAVQLIADSGSTKCEWVLVNNGRTKTIVTQGISPYFLKETEIVHLLQQALVKKVKVPVDEIHFYGTGLSNPTNVKVITRALKTLFPGVPLEVQTDLLAAARALCGRDKGVVAILGTGSNSCYYNGKRVVKNSPGLGYVLGDEGSGAYLGKKTIQYYLYKTFDEELNYRFEQRFETTAHDILNHVYKQPLPNRYLASFAIFLAENRGHYMVENIIEDGLNDFFFTHLYKYKESWTMPIHFIGSIAFGFKDVLKELCSTYELELGRVLKNTIEGLVKYHRK